MRAMAYETLRRAATFEFKVQSDLPSASFVFDRLFSSFPEIPPTEGIPTYRLSRSASDGRKFALDLDGQPLQRVDRAGSMVDWLIGEITRKAVALTDGFVAIHAGAASWRGRAVVLPAAPDSGKTTTVAALIEAGFSYLSDELALLHLETGIAHPFPRPLLMEPGSVEVVRGLQAKLPDEYECFRARLYHVAPDDLRPHAVGAPSPVSYVISPRYRMGSTTTLTPMTRAETLYVLGENSFNLDRVGSAGVSTLRRIAEGAPGYRLEIGDLRSAVECVIGLFGE
jgi:hypothetical protein